VRKAQSACGADRDAQKAAECDRVVGRRQDQRAAAILVHEYRAACEVAERKRPHGPRGVEFAGRRELPLQTPEYGF
jgi:hypothetical protein